MTCRELINFLMDYTDGTLSTEVRASFERHLSVCPSCVAFLDSYKKSVQLARESLCHEADDAVPPTVPRGLIEAILRSRRAGEES